MQSFGLNYNVKPECTEAFKATLKQLIEVMQGCEGHVETKLFADVMNPNSMMIYSNWETKAEFASFVRSEIFQQALKGAVGMLESTPSHLAGQDVRLIKPSE